MSKRRVESCAEPAKCQPLAKHGSWYLFALPSPRFLLLLSTCCLRLAWISFWHLLLKSVLPLSTAVHFEYIHDVLLQEQE